MPGNMTGNNALKVQRKLFLSLVMSALLFLVMGCAASAAGESRGEDHVHYTNDRFGFFFVYPSTLKAMPEPVNGDGIILKDEKTGMSVTASASYNVLNSDAETSAQSFVPEGVKAYKKDFPQNEKGKDTVLAWRHKGYVHWVRSAVFPEIKGSPERLATLYIKYPEKNEDRCRHLVDGMICSFVDVAE